MNYFLAFLAIIAVAALLIWLFSYGVAVFWPFIFGIAIFVVLKTIAETIEPKFGRLFEGIVGGALFVIIMGIILL